MDEFSGAYVSLTGRSRARMREACHRMQTEVHLETVGGAINTKLKRARRLLLTLAGSVSLIAGAAGPSWAIVGGRTAFYTDAPYIVAVLNNGQFLCGAAQLNDDTLISAAHCFPPSEQQNLSIVIGSLNWRTGGTDVPVSRVILNPGYDSSTSDNDIAILHTTRPMPGVRPVSLPTAGDDPLPGSTLKVSGWGATVSGGSTQDYLRTVNLPVVSRGVCASNYGGEDNITPNMICAGEEGRDACQGDSGGPAVESTLFGGRVLEGVVSFGRGCGLKNFPGVFARVSTYLDWIKDNE